MVVKPKATTVNLFADVFADMGYEIMSFTIGGRVYTRFTAPNGGVWMTRNARISYPLISATCKEIADSKNLSYDLCANHDIRVPQTVALYDLSDHQEEVSQLMQTGAVVVKPNGSHLSQGLRLNVDTPAKLQAAFVAAKQFCDVVLVQEQVTGEEVRFAVVDGEVKAAILRQTPRVIGDGQHTIAELLALENAQRRSYDMQFAIYPELDDELIDFSTVDLQTVPAAKQTIELSRATLIRQGASMYNVIDDIDDSYKQIALRAAQALGARFIVVDIMIEDIAQPCSDTNYAFIEFNGAPAVGLFYSCRGGQQYDIITDLAPRMDQAIQGAAA